jgi:hypothetical protein
LIHQGSAEQNYVEIVLHPNPNNYHQENTQEASCWWLTSVILVTWETEIGRTAVLGQPGRIAQETSSPK